MLKCQLLKPRLRKVVTAIERHILFKSYLDSIGIVESVKGASDIYAPVGGKILQINDAVIKTPSLVNLFPMEKGWLCSITNVQENELLELLSQSEYEDYCGNK